ncbi:endonuclease/exonuclease/phosphatase family protein [Treponema zuelzerae]|uniref:Endonuclease/exonuclease/phosphatase family protein n=1 Tax=Teretinema zuelzerae TaxID=156 RepID=A0AAE3EIB4_9SPIR|nr:endonuclease/exonuclease/phosphatase family protein [Teretinema zuelzerae]MCD1654034.1 endonuclease/exonuclease/phosphatase family protein [Teretinema zuelzerae]
MKRVLNILRRASATAAAVLLLAAGVFYLSTYHPRDIEEQKIVSTGEEPVLKQGQKIKILCWNVQFMAGKNYVFFFDEWDGSGPDERPSKQDIAVTFGEAARIIAEENPDIVLLQELDSGAKRTDGDDQLERLMKLLPKEYSARTAAWYWKASFVPHPKIMGSVGMKLAVISKYRMTRSVRRQLPLMPNNPVMRNLQFKRAVLEAVFPVEGGAPFSAFSVHMDAFAQGTDTMQRQAEKVSSMLAEKEETGGSWVIGGDFNLLPPGEAYSRLPENEKPYFQTESEIKRLYEEFAGFPPLEAVDGQEAERCFTHWPNYGSKPDRTLDYYFTGKNITVSDYRVRSRGTLAISDHLPIIIECSLP